MNSSPKVRLIESLPNAGKLIKINMFQEMPLLSNPQLLSTLLRRRRFPLVLSRLVRDAKKSAVAQPVHCLEASLWEEQPVQWAETPVQSTLKNNRSSLSALSRRVPREERRNPQARRLLLANLHSQRRFPRRSRWSPSRPRRTPRTPRREGRKSRRTRKRKRAQSEERNVSDTLFNCNNFANEDHKTFFFQSINFKSF